MNKYQVFCIIFTLLLSSFQNQQDPNHHHASTIHNLVPDLLLWAHKWWVNTLTPSLDLLNFWNSTNGILGSKTKIEANSNWTVKAQLIVASECKGDAQSRPSRLIAHRCYSGARSSTQSDTCLVWWEASFRTAISRTCDLWLCLPTAPPQTAALTSQMNRDMGKSAALLPAASCFLAQTLDCELHPQRWRDAVTTTKSYCYKETQWLMEKKTLCTVLV